MVEGIIIGVLATLIAALILGVVGAVRGAFKTPRKVRQWKTETGRAWKDYGTWARRRDRQLAEELQALDEALNARGMYTSGMRDQAHFKARRQATEDDVDQQTIRARAIDDAFNRLNKFDLLWMSLTIEGVGWKTRLRGMWTALTKPPLSFEADILEPVLRRLEDESRRNEGD